MEWYGTERAKIRVKQETNGVIVSYTTRHHKNITSKAMMFYFYGDSFTPFSETTYMCCSNPAKSRIYFSDAEIEGVRGYKICMNKNGGAPRVTITLANDNDEEIIAKWESYKLFPLHYDQEHGMYYIECEEPEPEIGKWKRVGADIVCPNCGFSVANIRRGEELNFCPNCGASNMNMASSATHNMLPHKRNNK